MREPLRCSTSYSGAPLASKMRDSRADSFCSGFFLAGAQFPVLWIFPWERWETLLVAFYLAAVVLLVARGSRVPCGIVCTLTALLTFCQALIRADVPAAVGRDRPVSCCGRALPPFALPNSDPRGAVRPRWWRNAILPSAYRVSQRSYRRTSQRSNFSRILAPSSRGYTYPSLRPRCFLTL